MDLNCNNRRPAAPQTCTSFDFYTDVLQLCWIFALCWLVWHYFFGAKIEDLGVSALPVDLAGVFK